jgi:hypothetical protein
MKMNLNNFLPIRQTEGRHDITILDAAVHKETEEAVVYRVRYRDETGAEGQQFYSVTSNGASRARLIFASLCSVCGLSCEQLNDFQPEMLQGCRLNVNLEQNEQGFMVIKSFRPIEKPEEC